MMRMRDLIESKTKHLEEDVFAVDGDLGRIQIAASPIRKSEVKAMIEQGKGLRMIVGSGEHRNLLVVWAGDSNSNIGAMHDTVANQFGIDLHYEKHVPLEMSPQGKMAVTTTAQAQFDDPREVEDVLDRNAEFRKIFGNGRVDMSKLDAW